MKKTVLMSGIIATAIIVSAPSNANWGKNELQNAPIHLIDAKQDYQKFLQDLATVSMEGMKARSSAAKQKVKDKLAELKKRGEALKGHPELDPSARNEVAEVLKEDIPEMEGLL